MGSDSVDIGFTVGLSNIAPDFGEGREIKNQEWQNQCSSCSSLLLLIMSDLAAKPSRHIGLLFSLPSD